MKNLRTKKWLQSVIMAVLLPSVSLVTMPVMGNPTGGVVVNGNVQFHNPSASHLQITQSTNTAIINWQDFSIAAGETTQFIQPNASAAVLNRVVSGNPSAIYGSLLANGNVFVVNPNGIVVGAGGVIDVGGNFVASTLDIDNDDFISGGANRFYGDSQTGVSNFGTITSRNGDVILLGGFVDNQGQIGAMNGTVALGSGGDILISEGAGSKITVQGTSDYTGTGVNNDGVIRGTSAELKSHGNVYALAINNGGAIRASGATRQNGRVRLSASGGSSNINLGTNSVVSAKRGSNGGDVEIDAGATGDVTIGGSMDVSGQSEGGSLSVVGRNVSQTETATINADGIVDGGSIALDAVESTQVSGVMSAEGQYGDGGLIDVTASDINIGSTASISVDGETSGGRIRVGGEFQGVDVIGLREADNVYVEKGAKLTSDSSMGDAGSVIVWANNDTTFLGDISASASGIEGNGGLIEVSGLNSFYAYGKIRATSVNGRSGSVLFDPGNLFVGNFGGVAPPAGGTVVNGVPTSNIEVAFINDTLQSGTSVILATQSGSIFFQDIDIVGMNGGGEQTSGELINPALADPFDMTDPNHPRNYSIQWTNSDAGFAAFASGSIFIENHIRTSGGGSINLMAGWTGGEADATLTSALINNNPEAAWKTYLDNGQFGENGGSIIVGSADMNRHVSVGSRFGNTNLAGATISITAADTNGESRWTQVGFSDSGQIFAPRFNRTDDNGLTDGDEYEFDLNDQTLTNLDPDRDPLFSDFVNGGNDNPVVAIAGNEFGQEVDIDGDGIVDGVYGINQAGVLDGSGTGTTSGSNVGTDATFIPYAVHYNSSRTGNWWWHHIDAADPDPSGLGGLRPEHGAGVGEFSTVAKALPGISDNNSANINIVAQNSVTLNGGGRSQSGAYIGHGGDTGGWADQRSLVNTGIENGQTTRTWSINGASNDRSAISIARLAPVYGNINVLAGVDPTTVNYNVSEGTIDAEVNGVGSVVLTGIQHLGGSGAPDNPEDGGGGGGAPVLIGHGGIGQFGSFNGDIDVRAGRNVEIIAGSQTRGFAQIGHSLSDFQYWNPTNNEDQQMRFFASYADFRDPLLRRGELFSGVTNIAQDAANDTLVGARRTDFELSNPGDAGAVTATSVTVAALDGSVVQTLTGDINVEAGSGNVIVRAFNTPDLTDEGTPINKTTERRFAKIGHGGTGRATWAEEAGYTANNNANNRFQELVNFRILTGDDDNSGAASVVGEAGTSLNRSGVFVNLIGDISVTSGGNVEVTGGSDHFDFAQIGHGGNELADYETFGVVAGNIDLDVGADLLVEAGGRVEYTGGGNRHQRAFAQIGHGGYRVGSQGYFGDIEVLVGGDATITGGSFGDSYAKIGHQGKDDWGQVAGEFEREEDFFFDGVETDITTTVDGSSVQYVLSSTDTSPNADPAYDNLNRTYNFDITSNTANIVVDVEGDLTLDHLNAGVRATANGATANVIDDAYVQIGHGGQNTDALNFNNVSYNYDDKIGDITVDAGNNILLQPGNFDGYYTRIGHGDGDEARITHSVFAMELGGRVTVRAENDIILDGQGELAARGTIAGQTQLTYEFENDQTNPGTTGYGDPSFNNPIQIGHGGVRNNYDIVVLSVGETINGIEADSTITVEAGNDISLVGGVGGTVGVTRIFNTTRSEVQRPGAASHVQIGHGFASDLANDRAFRNGISTGFDGDINVSAGNNLSLQGSSNAYSFTRDSLDAAAAESFGGAAFIGNGGYNLDAPASGDITVYVGNDLSITGGQRTDPEEGAAPEGGLNFAKIGHTVVENGASRFEAAFPTGGTSDDDIVTGAHLDGFITIVVGNNATLTGGNIAAGGGGEVFANFAQVGHGGPGITGNLSGDITFLVQNNLTTVDGRTDLVGPAGGGNPSNNYVMIGNGDWARDTTSDNRSHIIRRTGPGTREGDITVAVGNNASFDHTLVGHLDPNVFGVGLASAVDGNTRVAASRNNPFFGGTGVLSAENGSVFTSAFFGDGGMLQFFVPTRSTNQLDDTTRLNRTTFEESPVDFVGLDRSMDELAGRDDEVYLRPDLWWDNAELGLAAGFSETGGFPENGAAAQGGIIALVESPGGISNLTDLVQGSLGASADIYRGDGGYTLYFDAIRPVSTTLPPPPIVPIIFPDFDFSGFVFFNLFDDDLFDNLDDGENGLFGEGEGLLGILGLEDEFGEEESSQTAGERGLDSLFGDSRTPFSDEEDEEEARREEAIDGVASRVGGLTFYVFDPGTNRYSSYRVFGSRL